MTQEEKLKMLKESGIFVAGDLVLEKNVEHEIGNVAEGGIGIQINNITKQTSETKKVVRKLDVPKMVNDTFTYRYLSDKEGNLRLAKLHQLLTKERCGWLDKDVKPDTWLELFTGTPKEFTMKWKGTQQHLFYLFKLMLEREYISTPKGVGQWEIVGSHFVNKEGRPFTDWNGQHDPKRAERAISQLADILDIGQPLP